MQSSKSFGEGLDLLAPTSLRGSNSHALGKSVDGSLHVKSDEYQMKKPTSLPLMLVGDTRTTNSSVSDFFDDPLLILRQHAWSRIHQNITKERRLAGVMCLLVVVFLICYLPFWTVFLCLVSHVLTVLKFDSLRCVNVLCVMTNNICTRKIDLDPSICHWNDATLPT